jgi:shikimate dehydrogenase
MPLFGLIGYPLGHSFSASYFAEKFKKEGIDAVYRNFPLESVEEFKDLVRGREGLKTSQEGLKTRHGELRGLNVTVPYKQEIIPFLDSLSETAKAIGAVNTISFRRDKGQLFLSGDNTDVIGFRRSLEQHLKSHHDSALVLGTGGASRAVIYVLSKLGIDYKLVSRSSGDKKISYAELKEKMVDDTPLIINTTPLGTYPKVETFPPIPYKAISSDHLLFDLVYNPAKTEFLARGEKKGASIVNGYDMLVYQAEASWKIWNRK